MNFGVDFWVVLGMNFRRGLGVKCLSIWDDNWGGFGIQGVCKLSMHVYASV